MKPHYQPNCEHGVPILTTCLTCNRMTTREQLGLWRYFLVGFGVVCAIVVALAAAMPGAGVP